MSKNGTAAAISLGSLHAFAAVKRRFAWLLAAFCVALAFFSINNLHQGIDRQRRAANVSAWAEVSARLSELQHALQRERGMSSGYIATNGQSFGDALDAQRVVTDVALGRFFDLARSLKLSLAPWRLESDELRQLIGLTRQQISEMQVSRDVAVDRYVELIQRSLAFMQSGVTTGGNMLKAQLAYVSLLQAKEMAGQERALITAILSSGDFGYYSRVAALHRIDAVRQTYIESFQRFADEEGQFGYDSIRELPAWGQAESIRRRVIALGHSGPNPSGTLPDVEVWFEMSSAVIDTMQVLEEVLGLTVRRKAADEESQARTALMIDGFSALASFLFAAMLLWTVRSGKQQAEHNLRLAARVFSDSVEAIVITDRDDMIVDVNAAFCRISGYTREEAIGRHIRLLKSGRHSREFYEAMWARLLSFGNWEGEVWNRRKDGEVYPALLSIIAVRDPGHAQVNYIGMVVDLSQRKEAEALLEQMRTFDALTGLLSRDAWTSAMDRAVAASRGGQRKFAVVEIGLDRFKLINDSLGHAVGDRVLVEAAERVRRVLRRHDAAARMGGDRFSVLLEDIASAQNAAAICEKLLAAFVTPIIVDGQVLHVSISMGVAIFPDDGGDHSQLQRNAEAAMYRVKEDGRGSFQFYSSEMNAEGARLLAVESLLRQALVRGEFSLCYQPQVDATSGRVVGVEALIRWRNPELGMVSPVQFIPIAEETGLIVPIGDWVLRTACAQARAWMDEFDSELPVAVNLSARQFRKQDLMTTVQLTLDETGLPNRLLELEITEGSLIADPVGAADVLRGLREMGVHTAIDDFGTGYSSLAYLKTFPLDRLKIDRAFVRDLPESERDAAITRAVVTLARHLDMEVLAEGVETEAQSRFLREAGCDIIQGYYYGKPMTPKEFSLAVREGRLRLRDKLS